MTRGQLQRIRINRKLSNQPGPKKYLEFWQSIKSHHVTAVLQKSKLCNKQSD